MKSEFLRVEVSNKYKIFSSIYDCENMIVLFFSIKDDTSIKDIFVAHLVFSSAAIVA